jgi:hypothetical protein
MKKTKLLFVALVLISSVLFGQALWHQFLSRQEKQRIEAQIFPELEAFGARTTIPVKPYFVSVTGTTINVVFSTPQNLQESPEKNELVHQLQDKTKELLASHESWREKTLEITVAGEAPISGKNK